VRLAPAHCPVPGCGNPYLVWHDEEVALCLLHRDQAVRERLSAERLRLLQRAGLQPPHPGRSRTGWRHRKVLARVGGNFFYETPVILRLGPVTAVGFSRDDEGRLLLDVRMPTASGRPRATLVGSFWERPPAGADVACPRSGRLVDVAYPNGDRFRAELTDIHTARALQVRFGNVARWAYRVRFPLTLAELALTVANTDIQFGPHQTAMGGPTTVDCFSSHDTAALEIPMTPDQVAGLYPAGRVTDGG
jgi:hypothetical protein